MFSEFIKLLKLPLRLVAFIAILTGILFFLPTKLREYFLLTDFYSSYGKHVGLLFFISFAYFFLLLSEKVFRVIKRKRIQKQQECKLIKKLTVLSQQEMSILREFFFSDSDTISALKEDIGIHSLISDGIISIIYEASIMTIYGRQITIRLSEIAKKNLTEEMLGLYPEKYTDPTYLSKLEKERPAFVKQIAYIETLKSQVTNTFSKR